MLPKPKWDLKRHQSENNKLILSLKERIKNVPSHVWTALQSAPRGFFVPSSAIESSYNDEPLLSEGIHLSAPHMYVLQLQHLKLEEGQTFLDLGCGSGWFTTLAGIIVGPKGRAFGCDISEDIVTYSREHIRSVRIQLSLKLPSVIIFVQNAFFILPEVQRYDRVLCGASCPKEKLQQLANLLKIGGIMIIPIDNELLSINRTSEKKWTKTVICQVRFAEMKVPSDKEIQEAFQKQQILVEAAKNLYGGSKLSLMENLLAPAQNKNILSLKKALVDLVLRNANENQDESENQESNFKIDMLVAEATTQSLLIQSEKTSEQSQVSELEIPYKELNTKDEIGKGAFGVVRSGNYLGTPIAVKICTGISSPSSVQNFEQEIRLLSCCRHPNVVQMIGFSRDPKTGDAVLISELLETNLEKAIHDDPQSKYLQDIQGKLTISKQIALACNYLHNKKVIHQDLKPANILMDKYGQVKIADFGLARVLKDTLLSKTVGSSGTPLYMAPESFSKKKNITREDFQKRDVYSYAIILWELFSGKLPFEGEDITDPFALGMQILQGLRPQPIPPKMPVSLQEIMIKSWDENPSKRPSFFEIFKTIDSLSQKFPQAFEKNEKICIICMDAERDCIFLDCGHYTTCRSCAVDLKTCPVCRSKIKKVQQVFSS